MIDRETVLRLAKEADRLADEKETEAEWYFDFANLIAAEQRERDARICLSTGIKHPKQSGQEACAAAIRGQV